MKHQDCYAAHRFPPLKNCDFVYYIATTPFCCKFFNKKYFWELEYMCHKALKFYFDPSHTTREKNSQRKLSFSARLGDVIPGHFDNGTLNKVTHHFYLKIRIISELSTCPVKFGTSSPGVIFSLATASRSPCLTYLCCWLAHVLGKRTPSKIL